jgi:hypothetical protein
VLENLTDRDEISLNSGRAGIVVAHFIDEATHYLVVNISQRIALEEGQNPMGELLPQVVGESRVAFASVCSLAISASPKNHLSY